MLLEEGVFMGKILIVEFNDEEEKVFEEVIQLLRYGHGFSSMSLPEENILSISGIEINLEQRKVNNGNKEISLTSKEYGILCILAANKERTVSCEQIYQKVWGDYPDKGVNKTISFHIRNLRKKLNMDISESPFTIQCVREVGYSLKVQS